MIQLLVNIDVPDLEAATKFYVDAFGLTVNRRMGGEFRELLGAAVPIYLLTKQAGSVPVPGVAARSFERHWTPVHLDIAVPDLEAALARAVAAGARAETGITAHAWGRMVLLSDPFGNGIDLLDLTPGYDAIVER